MTDTVDLLSVNAGDRLQLSNGATVEVLHNPRDGMWLYCQYIANESEPSLVDGKEHPVFAQDVEKVLSEGAPQ